jgi:TolA-binding protein
MRRLALAAVLVLAASGALAQPALTPHALNPAAPMAPAPRAADAVPAVAFDTSTVATDLTGLNVRIEQDEVRMTQLRDPELARENAVIAAIRPALKFHGQDWFPLKY